MQNKESNIKLLLLGRAVSLFGSTIYLIVLPLYILNITKNLKTTGIFFAAVNFPTIIVSIFIGTIIEKFNKKNIILICDFLTSMLYFVLFLYLKNFNSLSFLFLISFFINIISKFFSYFINNSCKKDRKYPKETIIRIKLKSNVANK